MAKIVVQRCWKSKDPPVFIIFLVIVGYIWQERDFSKVKSEKRNKKFRKLNLVWKLESEMKISGQTPIQSLLSLGCSCVGVNCLAVLPNQFSFFYPLFKPLKISFNFTLTASFQSPKGGHLIEVRLYTTLSATQITNKTTLLHFYSFVHITLLYHCLLIFFLSFILLILQKKVWLVSEWVYLVGYKVFYCILYHLSANLKITE